MKSVDVLLRQNRTLVRGPPADPVAARKWVEKIRRLRDEVVRAVAEEVADIRAEADMTRHKRRDEPDDAADPQQPDDGTAPVPREGEAPRAPDGMPEGEGNRDDAAERDMGLRDESVMGAPPAAGGADAPETPEQENKRLRKELAEARAAIDSLVPAAAQQALGVDPKAARARKAGAAAAKEEKLPGDGPVVWEGSLPGAGVGFGEKKPLKFRGPDNEAEAREQFLRHARVRNTTGKVVVRRVEAEKAPKKGK